MAGGHRLTAESRRSGLTPGAPVFFAARLVRNNGGFAASLPGVTAALPSGKAGQQQYG